MRADFLESVRRLLIVPYPHLATIEDDLETEDASLNKVHTLRRARYEAYSALLIDDLFLYPSVATSLPIRSYIPHLT